MHSRVLHTIRDYANAAHGEQLRKYTLERYIVHPERVMQISSQHTDNTNVLAAALLHDVLEDTPVTSHELLNFLNQLMGMPAARETLKLVIELTDVYDKKAYPSWNRQKRKQMESERLAHVSPNAQTIKYADIIDNTREIMLHDPGFGKVFSRECHFKLELMTEGHQELRTKAIEVVQGNLVQVG